MRPLTHLNIVLQSLEADIQVAFARAWDAYQKLAEAAEHPRYPPTEPCIVCGKRACTYRWGQCTSWFSSLPGDEPRTTAVTNEKDFDPNISAGWLPLCSTDAFILDDHGNVTCPARLRQEGYYREC